MIDPDLGTVTVPIAGEIGRGWVTGVVSSVITAVTTLAAIWLKRKRPKSGAEDAVYETNRLTIIDLREQLSAARAENDALRSARNEAESAASFAQTQAKIAQQAAEAAAGAAQAATDQLEALRENWVRKLQYIHTLKSTLARHGIEVPPEPA